MAEVRITGACLEHVAQVDKKDDSKVYHSLFVYEDGQKYRRQLTEIKISAHGIDPATFEKTVNGAKSLVGKKQTLVCEMQQFDGRVTYYLKGVSN